MRNEIKQMVETCPECVRMLPSQSAEEQIQTVTSTNTVQELTDADFRVNQRSKENVTQTLIEIQFKTNGYKEIRNVRAFNEESLIGNLGGYIGLFLGVALWQIPDVISSLQSKLRSKK